VANPHALLRRLAEMEPGDLPVLSVYLDMRLHATGENPGVRSGLVVLKDRLREIEKTFPPRGPQLDSFRADAARIEEYLARDFGPDAHGLALFTCAGRDLFEEVEASVPFENQVAVGAVPEIFQLAQLLDDLETALVALVDSNTARFFVTRRGWLKELGGPDDNPKYYGKRAVGGLSQSNIQSHADEMRARFARQVAEELDRLVTRTGATRLILAGDEVAIPHLRNALPRHVADLVHDEVLRIDIRASQDAVQGEIDPLLTALEASDALAVADRLIGAIRADGLGVVGQRETRAALEQGQVDTLLLDPTAELGAEDRSELVGLATRTGGTIEIVEGHEAFAQLGGVGALLRYRLDWAPRHERDNT